MAYVPNSGSVVSFQGNPSVLQTLTGLMSTNASVITVGTAAANQSVSGTVQADIRGSVATVIIGGSIAASFTPPANQSVSGTVHVDNFSSVVSYQLAGSVLSVTSPANQSVSGAVSVSNFPATQNVSGSVAAWLQSTNASVITVGSPVANQSVSGTVGASIIGVGIQRLDQQIIGSSFGIITNTVIHGLTSAGGGSYVDVKVSPSGALLVENTPSGGNQSVSGTVNVGNFPTSQNVSGSVVAFQGTTPWANTNVGSVITVSQGSVATVIIGGSIAASFTPPANQSVSGTVGASVIGTVPVTQSGTVITSLVSTIPSSVIVGASIFGTAPVTQAGTWTASVFGNLSVLGTVPVTQSGTWSPSALSYLTRNDTLASTLGADGTLGLATRDSAGRTVVKPFAAEEATFSYTGSVVSGSVTLIAPSAIGKRNYITDFWAANTGVLTTLLTFRGGDTSVVGYTIVPAGGGSNSPGIHVPLKTTASQDLAFAASPSTSVLYLTVRGYQAP